MHHFGKYDYDLHLLQLIKPFRGLDIAFNSCFLLAPNVPNEFYLDDLRVETFIPNQFNFFLHLFPKSIYDKIFWLNKPRSGYKDFDKIIGFDTNRLWELRKFFAIEAVRDLIQNDYYALFNVRYEKEMLIVKNQSTQLILNKAGLLAEYDKFVLFIDGLIEAKLIKL